MDEREFARQSHEFGAFVEELLNQMFVALALKGNLEGLHPGVFYCGAANALCSQLSKVIVESNREREELDEEAVQNSVRTLRQFLGMSRRHWDETHPKAEPPPDPKAVADEMVKDSMAEAKRRGKGSEKKEG